MDKDLRGSEAAKTSTNCSSTEGQRVHSAKRGLAEGVVSKDRRASTSTATDCTDRQNVSTSTTLNGGSYSTSRAFVAKVGDVDGVIPSPPLINAELTTPAETAPMLMESAPAPPSMVAPESVLTPADWKKMVFHHHQGVEVSTTIGNAGVRGSHPLLRHRRW